MSQHSIGSSIPLPPDAEGPMPTPATEAIADQTPVVAARFTGNNEGYFSLVWRRFRRSVIGMIGLVLVVAMLVIPLLILFVMMRLGE